MADTTLFTPLRLGSLSLPNRVIMAPLTRARTPDSVPGKLQQAYYGQRAGAGLIISEATNISPTARGYVYTPGIWTDARKPAGSRSSRPCMPRAGALPCNSGTLARVP